MLVECRPHWYSSMANPQEDCSFPHLFSFFPRLFSFPSLEGSAVRILLISAASSVLSRCFGHNLVFRSQAGDSFYAWSIRADGSA